MLLWDKIRERYFFKKGIVMYFFRRLAHCLMVWARFTHVSWQVLYGVWRITVLRGPIVSIFGGSRIDKTNYYFTQAHWIASQLVARDISVITGGGTGIMEAANCGAIDPNCNRVRSIGIGVEGLDQGPNPCVSEYFELHYFFARKWLMTKYSSAFIFLPGGFGTLDELFEIVTLMQTNKMPQLPIFLVGVEYWRGGFEWLSKTVLVSGAIPAAALNIMFLTDDLELVVNTIIKQPALKK